MCAIANFLVLIKEVSFVYSLLGVLFLRSAGVGCLGMGLLSARDIL